MGEIVNLRRARKSLERRRDEAQAEQNRIRSRPEQGREQLAEKTRAQATRNLDGHLRDGGEFAGRPRQDLSLNALDDPGRMQKHSLVIAGHRTSISLETVFWDALRDLACEKDVSIAALAAEIDSARGEANLSSALRVYVLNVLLDRTGPASENHWPCGADSALSLARSCARKTSIRDCSRSSARIATALTKPVASTRRTDAGQTPDHTTFPRAGGIPLGVFCAAIESASVKFASRRSKAPSSAALFCHKAQPAGGKAERKIGLRPMPGVAGEIVVELLRHQGRVEGRVARLAGGQRLIRRRRRRAHDREIARLCAAAARQRRDQSGGIGAIAGEMEISAEFC